MNQITEVKLTQDGYGCWSVSVTKALEDGLYTKTYPAGAIHNALDVARSAVTLTPANVVAAEACGWRRPDDMTQEAMERR